MKRLFALVLALAMVFALSACGETEKPAATSAEVQTVIPDDDTPANDTPATNDTPADNNAQEQNTPAENTDPADENVAVRVGSLKGPTSMGIVNLMKKVENEGTIDGVDYSFVMATQADEIAAGLTSGDIDIALIPANLASVLYNKTEGKLTVIDINTLGVLYCVTGDENIRNVTDLAGKTVILTGQGNTPEYSLRYLLAAYGIEDVTLEFKSEATEVAAALAADPTAVGVLPQPFATVAQVQNTELHEAFSLSDEWDRVGGGSRMVTGVTVVRCAFLDEHPEAVEKFLNEHKLSTEAASDVDATAELVAEYGIIEKAPIAKKALPKCAISCITGAEMRTALEGYLVALYNAEPKSVGGYLPDDAFYYEG